MPKSRRRRGRHLPQSKKRKGVLAPVAQPSAVTQRYEPTPQAGMPTPPARVPNPKTTVTVAPPTNIAAELRRIGILTGIIVVILIVLTLFFS
jgi:hypothetical protein